MTADEILNKIADLPPAPIAASKLLSLLKNPTVDSIDEVVETLEYDPALTARLLRACNSAFMAGHASVDSVDQAVLRLGYYEILRVVLALTVGGVLSKGLPGYGVDSYELWSHSITAALASQKLMETSRGLDATPSVAFTAGLLHDIGKVVLNHLTLPEVENIRVMIHTNGASLLEAETAVLGVNHAEIGACLLKRWKLSGAIVEAVARHHTPPVDKGPQLAGVVHLANGCAHFVGSSYGWESFAIRIRPEIMETLNLKPEDIERTMIFIHSESNRIKQFMSIV
ncbi:MAG: HDOD domain-containing protein [Verrucomicrobiae bacterium]|nr:HDOD domain-containing protein [Verrucomicrobiae bacterium]